MCCSPNNHNWRVGDGYVTAHPECRAFGLFQKFLKETADQPAVWNEFRRFDVRDVPKETMSLLEAHMRMMGIWDCFPETTFQDLFDVL